MSYEEEDMYIHTYIHTYRFVSWESWDVLSGLSSAPGYIPWTGIYIYIYICIYIYITYILHIYYIYIYIYIYRQPQRVGGQ
jgi:hypothetical protein